jgi:hypothetical protein
VILEYILLLTMFVMFVGSVIFKGPNDAFKNAGPKLGARVEKHLITGDKFSRDKSVPSTKWVEK